MASWPRVILARAVLVIATAALLARGVRGPAPAAAQEPSVAPSIGARDAVARRLLTESFRSNGVVTTGPDRFPYVSAFRAPAAAASADDKQYAMRDLAQLALAKHAGIAVYERTQAERPVYVFPLGGVAGIAEGRWQPFDRTTPIALAPGDEVVVGTPSLDALPAELRRAIADYMRTVDGVATPKMALVVVKKSSGEYRPPPYEMSPNLPRSRFPTEDAWAEALHRIEWFIPPQYIAVRPPQTDARFAQWFDIVEPLSP